MRKIYQIGPQKELKGGIATVIRNINESNLMNNSYEIVNIPTISAKGYICFLWSSLKAFTIKSDSILHFHVASNGSFFRKYIMFKLSNKKCKKIFHLHGGGFINFCTNSNKFTNKLIEDMLKKSDLIINVSDYMMNQLIEIFPDIKNKCTRIYNGVDYKDKNIKFSDKQNYILFMGKLVEYKGIYDLIKILVDLSNFLRKSNWKVKIAGNGNIDQIKNIIKDKKLEDFVEVVGWIDGDKKEKLLEESKIFIMPSHVESFGIAAIEAMQNGNAIIASDAGALPEIIENDNGYIIKGKNYKKYGEAIKRLVNDEIILEKISVANIKEAKNFSVEGMIKNIIVEYENV